MTPSVGRPRKSPQTILAAAIADKWDRPLVELAARVGVSRRTLDSYRAGRTSPSLVVAAKLAEVLGVDFITWFVSNKAVTPSDMEAQPHKTKDASR